MSEPNHTEAAPAEPAAAGQPCDTCATPGEKMLAVFGILLGVLVLAMAVDMFSGGKLTGMVQQRAGGD